MTEVFPSGFSSWTVLHWPQYPPPVPLGEQLACTSVHLCARGPVHSKKQQKVVGHHNIWLEKHRAVLPADNLGQLVVIFRSKRVVKVISIGITTFVTSNTVRTDATVKNFSHQAK